jgi:exosortase
LRTTLIERRYNPTADKSARPQSGDKSPHSMPLRSLRPVILISVFSISAFQLFLPMFPLTLAALWLHFFWCLVPSWRFGQYYEYGFLVPVLAFGFAWRRGGMLDGLPSLPWQPGKRAERLLWLCAMVGLLALIPLRVVETGDPGWRPPIVLHGLLVTLASHLVLARWRGWKVSAFFLPVTIFAWSAVPYFYQIEQSLVRHLTGMVVGLTREVFLLDGQPVEQVGERLYMGARAVDVTDGCSGIRSIQSLVMAALFFGELLWLRWPARLALVGTGLVAAVACNTGRAWYLASVQFSRGEEAAHAAHDPAGHIAFVVAAFALYLAARLLMPRARGRVVVRKNAEILKG